MQRRRPLTTRSHGDRFSGAEIERWRALDAGHHVRSLRKP
jgi:hypothetical protein